MAITLAEAKNFTQDKLAQLVIDEFRKDPLLGMMVFDNCVSPAGNTLAYTYNRVTTLPTAAFRALNAEYTPQESKTTQYTANLKPFGGSFQVDRVIQDNVKGITDQITFQLGQKINATKALFADTFVNGDSGVDANAFDGLDKAVTGSSTENVPSAVIDLSSSSAIDSNYKAFMDVLDKWLADLDGTPSALLLNRVMKAIMNGVARRSATFKEEKNEFGVPILTYAGIPLLPVGDKPGSSNPIIPIGAGKGSYAADTNVTSIYAVRISLDGVHAVSPTGNDLVKTYLPNMTLPGAVKTGEVEMVSAMALKATRAAGALRRIKVG